MATHKVNLQHAITAEFVIEMRAALNALVKSAMLRLTNKDEMTVFDVDGQFVMVTLHPNASDLEDNTDYYVYPVSVQFYDETLDENGTQDDEGTYLDEKGPYGSVIEVEMCYGRTGRLCQIRTELDGERDERDLI